MSSIEILTIICISSFFGAILIIGLKIYSLKEEGEEDVTQWLLENGRFLPRISFKFPPFFSRAARVCVSCFNGVCARCKKDYRKFSDNMRGKHEIKSEGVSGYWEEVNGYKNGLNSNGGVSEEEKEE